jgi:hypothetical protein
MRPGADNRVAVADSVEAALYDRLGGQLAGRNEPRERGRGEAMRLGIGHGRCSVDPGVAITTALSNQGWRDPASVETACPGLAGADAARRA